MSSQVQSIKAGLSTFATSTERSASALSAQRKQFDQSSQQIAALIGGSSTSKDREVMSAIQQAQRAVEQASSALHQAARTAKQYAASI